MCLFSIHTDFVIFRHLFERIDNKTIVIENSNEVNSIDDKKVMETFHLQISKTKIDTAHMH